ncbi:hypothetical protein E1269_09150 [Jiangella asiatica]|uniref:Integrase catalytic domain-containing protein n=1 Tax=Jiangella asiatica TaxID=2530372 RepID=A0A4R5DEB5_9ACTN|nr:hypothetical protein E1269_09150 [Jiangella asiatica]
MSLIAQQSLCRPFVFTHRAYLCGLHLCHFSDSNLPARLHSRPAHPCAGTTERIKRVFRSKLRSGQRRPAERRSGRRKQRRDGVVFALLQSNVLDRRRWASRHELRLAIITWIERTYRRRRRQARLGRLKPIEYETINTTQVALAA